jgi:tRNA ligase
MHDREPFDPAVNKSDQMFDHVIKVGIEEDISIRLREVIDELVPILGLERPTEEAIDDAIKQSLDYVPKNFAKKQTPNKMDYDWFGVLLDYGQHKLDIGKMMTRLFSNQTFEPGKNSVYWSIQRKNAWKTDPHVTLIHSADITDSLEKQKLWLEYEKLCEPNYKKRGPAFEVEVTTGPKLLWNSRIMALQVSSIKSVSSEVPLPLDPDLPAHITLGLKNQKQIRYDDNKDPVKPVEAKYLTKAFKEGKETMEVGGKIHSMDVEPMVLIGRLSGSYKNIKKQKIHVTNWKPPRPNPT